MRTVKQMQALIDALYKEILEAQEACGHFSTKRVDKTGYGGYITECDHWTEVTCLDCNYRWIEDQ